MKKLEAQKLDLLDPLGSLETHELPTGPHRGRAANPLAIFILTSVLLPRLEQGGGEPLREEVLTVLLDRSNY